MKPISKEIYPPVIQLNGPLVYLPEQALTFFVSQTLPLRLSRLVGSATTTTRLGRFPNDARTWKIEATFKA
jgi:hypothetical protein